MQILRLDHVNLRTTQLETMIQWYTEFLDLQLGSRPNFPFEGAWLYAGDIAIVHIIVIDDDNAVGAEDSLKLEHFALRGTDIRAFEAKLKARNERYRRSDITDFGIAQFNIWDPDGNHIHVDFALSEKD